MKSTAIVSSALLAVLTMACGESEVTGKTAAEVTDAAPAPVSAQAAAKPSAGDSTVELEEGRSTLSFIASTAAGDRSGKFNDLDGALTYTAGAPSKVSFSFGIDSVSTGDANLDRVLAKSDFFDATKYPRPQFVSTAIDAAPGEDGNTHRISGVLTMHGSPKNVSFPARVELSPGGIHAKSEFTIARKKWNLNFAGPAATLTKDDVLIKLDLHFPPAGA